MGSDRTGGSKSPSLKLIQAPKLDIDYVILHELGHLKEHNHSPAFYALLGRVLPGWRERRAGLSRIEIN